MYAENVVIHMECILYYIVRKIPAILTRKLWEI